MKKDDFDRVLEEISISASRRRSDEYQSLLYNDLREIIVSGDEIDPLMLRALSEVPIISRDKRFVEAYLGAFAYYYKFAIRRRVGIFSPPAEFGLRYDFRQQFFSEFVKLLHLKIDQCEARQKIYYSAIINKPDQNLKYALGIIGGDHKSRIDKKNAAILLCHSVWRKSALINAVPLLDGIDCGSRRLKATVDLYLGRLGFKSALALVREGGADEDRELEWCQSFISVVVALGVLFSYPCEQAIDLVFDEIERLRYLPVSRGYEFEFDAYKCLNEDAALIVEKWSAKRGGRWQRLVDYFLLQTREFGLQSHELLRCSVLVADSEPVMDRKRIKIYDYQTEIVPCEEQMLGFTTVRRNW